jgi:hypothetical protein
VRSSVASGGDRVRVASRYTSSPWLPVVPTQPDRASTPTPAPSRTRSAARRSPERASSRALRPCLHWSRTWPEARTSSSRTFTCLKSRSGRTPRRLDHWLPGSTDCLSFGRGSRRTSSRKHDADVAYRRSVQLRRGAMAAQKRLVARPDIEYASRGATLNEVVDPLVDLFQRDPSRSPSPAYCIASVKGSPKRLRPAPSIVNASTSSTLRWPIFSTLPSALPITRCSPVIG